nr:retrovirus-related Pol polyprotein from transposon TNT 1-94 [Tanacetum cinerariifolium]
MTGAKFDIEKIDGTGDFELWRINMRALLIQHECEAALEVLSADVEAQTKAELNKKAHSVVILYLGNTVLREVTGETTTAGVWSKLETLYMIKSLANKLYLKKKLYTFYMPAGRKISKHIDEFNKIVLVANIEATLNFKEIKERSKAKGDNGEGLYVRGRTDHKDLRQSRGKSRSKSRGGRLKCYICQFEDHLKRNYPKNNRKKSTCYVKKDEQPSSSGSTYEDSKVMMVMSVQEQALLDWIMDLGCSYHITPRKVTSSQFRCRKAHYSGSDRLCSFRFMRSVSGGIIRRTVKKLRTNNGLELCNREFEHLCIESGIARHLTVSGMPQQNGVAERMNKKLVDKVRCLLIQSGLPNTFWAEATCTTAYLINRSPLRAIEKKTPMEMWSGHPSDYSMLRIFGCVAYPHVKQAEEEDTHEPFTYQEVVACEDSSKWKASMKVEMDSLRKNKTWKLVDHPAGQKLSPRKWYKRFDEYMLMNRFKCSSYESCISYMSYAPGDYIYLLLYVDDMLIACKSKVEIGSTKSLLKKKFDIKELGEAKKILGMEIVRDQIRMILRVSQSGYVSKILNNFRIDNEKSVNIPLGGHFKLSLKDCPVRDCDVERMSKVPYANAVGSLVYLMVCTRLDIAYAVSVVNKYLANPSKNHWEAVKWILKYLRGTTNVGLVYGINRGNHVDGCVVSGKATLQHVVALSTTEAEYMALTEAVKEAIWLRGLLEELGVELNTMAVNCDNQGTIHLSQNHVFHEWTKHINVLEAKTVKVMKLGTEHNVADALTKVVPGLKLQHFLELLNVGVG